MTRWLIRGAAGLLCLFFAVSGVLIAAQFGAEAWGYARVGGVMFWAAFAMGCTATVGLIFTLVFGYLSTRLFARSHWGAAAVLALALVVVAWGWNRLGSCDLPLVLPIDGCTEVHEMVGSEVGELIPLGFSFVADAAEGQGIRARVLSSYRGRTEQRVLHLQPGEPQRSRGWLLCFRRVALYNGVPHAELRVIREPGHYLLLGGALGALGCLAALLLGAGKRER
ncbi:MAG: hypothetical protein ACI4P8_02730 [Akkermansia sp.]